MPIDVPGWLKDNAQRGLDYNREGKGGDGLTDKTLDEAREFARGFTTESKVRRMPAWFARHKPDLDAPKNKPGNEDFPGAGAVAWLIWGGSVSGDVMDAADWAQRQVEKLDREAQAFDRSRKVMASIEEQFIKAQAELSAAIAERCDLQANFEKLVADNDTALAAVKAEAEAANLALTEAKAALAALESEKAELLKQIEAAMQGQVSASKEAAKIAASVGCKPAALSPADEGQAQPEASAADIRKAFLGMKPGPDKSAFFAAHRAILTATR